MSTKRTVMGLITATVAAATLAAGAATLKATDVYHDMVNEAIGNGVATSSSITSDQGSGVYHDM